jgi:hypothetical protein
MKKLNFICGVMLALSVAATHPVEGRDSSPEAAVKSKQTDNALKIFSRSTQFIEAAPAFSASGHAGGELLMENGQLIEHGTSFTVTFVRPAKLYLKLNSRDGSGATMVFDGETVTAASSIDNRHIYDTTAQQGDVNDSLDLLSRKSGGSRELAYFLTEQMTKTLTTVQTGFSLGKSTIDGVLCDHLALRSETRDLQVWIERGDEPRPWRILITHREKPEKPRFWIQFNEWNFSPELSESTIKYTPPEGAVRFDYFSE